jgi:hypothetical protein
MEKEKQNWWNSNPRPYVTAPGHLAIRTLNLWTLSDKRTTVSGENLEISDEKKNPAFW